MSRAIVITGLLSVCLAVPSTLRAQPDEAQGESAGQASAGAETPESGPPAPNVELETLLTQVAERSSREFLIDSRASRRVYVGGLSLAEIDYPRLLAILRANDLAATETEDLIYVSPAGWKRQLPSRIVSEDDAGIRG